MNLVFHETAILEIRVAAQWLDEKAGLGSEFANDLRDVLSSITSDPFQFGPAPYSRHEDEIRIGMVRRFKYSIYFKVYRQASRVFIIAVQHGHRHPRHWIERLGDFNLSDG